MTEWGLAAFEVKADCDWVDEVKWVFLVEFEADLRSWLDYSCFWFFLRAFWVVGARAWVFQFFRIINKSLSN